MRWLKIVLVLLVALWGILGALGNLLKLDVAYRMVLATTRIPGAEPGAAPPWATESAFVGVLGVALILLGKLAPAVLCTWGAVRMTAARGATVEDWQRSKSLGVIGCGLALALLFMGWTVIGEFVFMMYLDPGLSQAAAAAFRYAGFIGLIMVFVAQRE